jgi:uncharacterized MAPEG superfamily protein
MTTAYICVFIIAMMPFICAGISKWDTSYNNYKPREWAAKLEGYRARAQAAQMNCWEALPFFGIAVIVAHLLKSSQSWLDGLAIAFVILRVVYLALYLANKAPLRSAVWMMAIGVNIVIFFVR